MVLLALGSTRRIGSACLSLAWSLRLWVSSALPYFGISGGFLFLFFCGILPGQKRREKDYAIPCFQLIIHTYFGDTDRKWIDTSSAPPLHRTRIDGHGHTEYMAFQLKPQVMSLTIPPVNRTFHHSPCAYRMSASTVLVACPAPALASSLPCRTVDQLIDSWI